MEQVIGRISRLHTYLWPAPGKSTHPRIVDSGRWRITRLVAYPLLAGIAVIAIAGFSNPRSLHGEYVDGVEVVTVR